MSGVYVGSHSYVSLMTLSVCCSVLQCVAVCCSVLQCVAVRCAYLRVRVSILYPPTTGEIALQTPRTSRLPDC